MAGGVPTWSIAGGDSRNEPSVGGALDRMSDLEYLRHIERLSKKVVDEALERPWFAYGTEGDAAADSLQRAVNRLASHLRYAHYDGDGCLESIDESGDLK